MKILIFVLVVKKKGLYLQRLSEKEARSENIRAVSSVGSEHLVYTQGVGGSTPSPPTKGRYFSGFLCFREQKDSEHPG